MDTQRLNSWVETANSAQTQFPLNNLPYGVFVADAGPTCGVAIGDYILDLTKAALSSVDRGLFANGSWNAFMAAGPETWQKFRAEITALLSHGAEAHPEWLVPQASVSMLLPFQVTEFTDFYAGRHHATNVGTMFRGAENALPPNWLHMPIGYNGRASSIVVSGSDVVRPKGQLKGPDDAAPRFAPSQRFDFELELGAIVGQASDRPLSVAEADKNIFGYVLLNDWSARDIQAWEYQPLGPFQAKATATTISPWIVPQAALEPFRVDCPKREFELLPHLKDAGPMLYDIDLTVSLIEDQGPSTLLTETNFCEMYYSSAQQIAHHSSSGCPMRVGDLIGSGTISGAQKHQCGSMLELSWGGKEPIQTASGSKRTFINDTDTILMTGAAKNKEFQIGFGECRGKLIAG